MSTRCRHTVRPSLNPDPNPDLLSWKFAHRLLLHRGMLPSNFGSSVPSKRRKHWFQTGASGHLLSLFRQVQIEGKLWFQIPMVQGSSRIITPLLAECSLDSTYRLLWGLHRASNAASGKGPAGLRLRWSGESPGIQLRGPLARGATHW